jgi:hypothetical protein
MHLLNPRRPWRRAAPFCLALLGLLPAAARAQPTASDRAWNLATNSMIGGVAAAVRATIAGRDPGRAFVRGAGGGLLVGAGRQVAASRFDGAGLIGRQLSAAGISAIRSATLDTAAWLVPVGPLKLWVVPRSDDRLRARLSVAETAALLYYVARDDARLDGGATLSAGAPVFRVSDRTFGTRDGEALGRMDAGVILLGAADEPYSVERDTPLAHEAVHVLQLDFASEILTGDAESWALRQLLGDRIASRLEAGVLSPLLLGGVNMVTSYSDRPWEREAERLSEVLH